MMSTDSLQLLLVDGLFICLAGAMGLWFRAWIKAQRKELDSRMEALEAQHESLDRLGGRLLAACRSLEGVYPHAKNASTSDATGGGPTPLSPLLRRPEPDKGRNTTAARETSLGSADLLRFQGGESGASGVAADESARVSGPSRPSRRANSEGIRGTGFARARDLLAQGLPAKEVARRLGMGMAEVEAIKRMVDIEPRSARSG